MTAAEAADRATAVALMVDPPGSRDLDDAILVREPRPGAEGVEWLLTVFVTAVPDSVPVGGPADERARAATATAYRRHGSDPMLGARLESGVSLTPHAARSALAVDMAVALDGTVVAHDLYRAKLPRGSCAQLTYASAASALADPSMPHHEHLVRAERLAAALLSRRARGSGFAVYDFAHGFESTEEGSLAVLPDGHRNAGYAIVRECMIAANSAVARWALETDTEVLYRCHSRHSASPTVAELEGSIASSLGSPDRFAELAEQLETMAAGTACYSPGASRHDGLGLQAYAHATSPARRYADLATVRCVLARLDGQPPPYAPGELRELAEHLNSVTRAAREAKSAGFKQRDQRVTASIVVRPQHDPRELTAERWTKVLEAAVGMQRVGWVAEELERRARAGTLTPRDVGVLMLSGDGWAETRLAVYEHAQKNQREHGRSALSIWQALAKQPGEPVFSVTELKNGMTPVFMARVRVGDRHSEWVSGSTKKAAQQDACWSLLRVIGGHVKTSVSDPEPPRALPATTFNPSVRRATGAAVRMMAPASTAVASAAGVSALELAVGAGADHDAVSLFDAAMAAMVQPVSWMDARANATGAKKPCVDYNPPASSRPGDATRCTLSFAGVYGRGFGHVRDIARDIAARQVVAAVFGAAVRELLAGGGSAPDGGRPDATAGEQTSSSAAHGAADGTADRAAGETASKPDATGEETEWTTTDPQGA